MSGGGLRRVVVIITDNSSFSKLFSRFLLFATDDYEGGQQCLRLIDRTRWMYNNDSMGVVRDLYTLTWMIFESPPVVV